MRGIKNKNPKTDVTTVNMKAVLNTFACVVCFLHSAVYVTCIPSKDYFDEELLLKPLPSGHIYAYFQFTTVWDVEFEANSCK
jgi:Gpi16 subunit, GPI transamidase component.